MTRLRREAAPYLLILGALFTLACNLPFLAAGGGAPEGGQAAAPELSATPSPVLITATPLTPTITPTLTPTPSPTETPTPAPTPYGCQRPPDDYTRVVIDDMTFNQRTLWMLDRAQMLYGGPHDFRRALTQGSYNPGGVSASFGTHDGGGALDLSVRDQANWNHIIYDGFDAIILALRQAGFAAWVREVGDLYEDSPIHIHAIAIGDAELSEAAQDQLTGPAGYFYGYNGLPEDPPLPDERGGPYVCPWMVEMGYPGG
jgi:hypothetical protein